MKGPFVEDFIIALSHFGDNLRIVIKEKERELHISSVYMNEDKLVIECREVEEK